MTASENARLLESDSPQARYGSGVASRNDMDQGSQRQPSASDESKHVDYPNGSNVSNGSNGSDVLEIDVDDAIEMIGMGRVQSEVMLCTGMCFVSNSLQVFLVSFLNVVLEAEWDLTEREMDTVFSISFAGALIGALFMGHLADCIGRKPVFVMTAAINAVCGVLTGMVDDVRWFFVIRFIVGIGVGGLAIPYDTLAEVIPTSHRGTKMTYMQFFWTAGTMLSPLIAKFTLGVGGDNAWRWFAFSCAVPCVLCLIICLVWVFESPRWLLAKGRHKEAVETLRKLAYKNGKDGMMMFPAHTELVVREAEAEGDGSCSKLLSPKWAMTVLKLCSVWFGFFSLFYGSFLLITLLFSSQDFDQGHSSFNGNHSNNINDNDGSDKLYDFNYDAIFISTAAELFGSFACIAVVDRLGRIMTQSLTSFLGGTCCLILGFLSESDGVPKWPFVALGFSVRFFMAAGDAATWLYASEVFTTEVRGAGHGAVNAVARLGAFLVPYVVTPGTSASNVGLNLFLIGTITATIAWQLPETSGIALGTAVDQAADLDENCEKVANATATDDDHNDALPASSL